MHPRLAFEEVRHFDPCVGFSSNDDDTSRSSPIAINLGHYNSGDGRSICIHLTPFKARALIGDHVDLKST